MFFKNFIPVYKKQKFGLRTSAESHNNVFKKVFTNLDKYRKNLIKNDQALHKCFDELMRLYKLNNNSKYIDIGCGGGNLVFMLSKYIRKIYASDISDYIIKKNKQKNKKINFFVDDIVKKKKREKYDIISMCGVLYAVDENPETHIKIFQNLKNMMKTKSTLVFYHRLNLSLVNFIDIKINKNDEKKLGESYQKAYFNDNYINNLCKKTGLSIIKKTKIDHEFNLYNTFISKYCVGKKNIKKKNEKRKLNFFGIFLLFISKNFFEDLLSRSSMFIIKKN